MTTNKPAHEIRMGRIRCTIWANSGEYGPRYDFTFSRLFKGPNGWKDSDYFGRDDLLTVAQLAHEAHAWAFQEGRDATGKTYRQGSHE